MRDKSWEKVGQVVGKSGSSRGKKWDKSLEKVGPVVGKSGTSRGKKWGKSWEKVGPVVEQSGASLIKEFVPFSVKNTCFQARNFLLQ